VNITTTSIPVKTSKRCDMIDITAQIAAVIAESGITEGDCTIFCQHTTGGITINENADPDVIHDMLMTLEQLFPKNRPGYRHCEGNSDSHIKSTLTGCSEQILVKDGKPLLGVWQGIYFCEYDGPRNRTVQIQVTGR